MGAFRPWLLIPILLLISIQWMALGGFDAPLKIRNLPHKVATRTTTAWGDRIALPDNRIVSRRQFITNKRGDVAISGNIALGRYSAEVEVGGSTKQLVIDTGSSVLYIAGPGCDVLTGPYEGPNSWYSVCQTKNDYLDTPPVALDCYSTTGCTGCGYDDICDVSTQYGEGSWVVASAYNTSLGLDEYLSSNASIGLFTSCSQNYVADNNDWDGVWGMGFSYYSFLGTHTLPSTIDSLVEAGMPNIFALYLSNSGGTLTIGGYNTQYSYSGIRYVPLIAAGWYSTPNPTIAVNGLVISATPNTRTYTIVDSATTYISLPSNYWTALVEAMQQISTPCPAYFCGSQTIFQTPQLCFSDIPFETYPTITFTISDQILSLFPRDYMVSSVDISGKICHSFGVESNTANVIILGDTFMNTFYTIFDRANSQIGFAYVGNGNSPSGQNPAIYNFSLSFTLLALASFLIL